MLKGKTALVTGANGGIGKAILNVFAKNHANIFAHARKENESLEAMCGQLSQTYQTRICPLYFDLTKEDEIRHGIQRMYQISKNIDILVNNAGMVGSANLFQMTDITQMKQEFDVNFFAQIRIAQLVSRKMIRAKKGSIIQISSCAGIDGNTGMLEYVSGKAALIGACKRMAIELGAYGIRVNSVAPGLTDTAMGNRMSKELEQETLAHQIFARKAKPQEVADAVLFFASDLSSFITGQVLRVDGGMLK